MKRMMRIALGLSVAALVLAGCANLPSAQPDAGWTTLYDNGMNLNDWTTVGEANWRLQDGAIQADLLYRGKDPSYLVTKQVYGDFQLRAEFWVDSQTNSGIFIRCEDANKVNSKTAYEVNVWDTRPDPTYGTGAVVGIAKVTQPIKAGGQWNTYDITAKGSHFSIVLNGVKTAEGNDSQHARGHIALQYGSGIVKFRKVQIRAL